MWVWSWATSCHISMYSAVPEAPASWNTPPPKQPGSAHVESQNARNAPIVTASLPRGIVISKTAITIDPSSPPRTMQPICQLAKGCRMGARPFSHRWFCRRRPHRLGTLGGVAPEMPGGPPIFGGSGRAPDAELGHARLEGRWGQPEHARRALGATHAPSGLLEDPHDVGTLDVLEHQADGSRLGPGLWAVDPQRPLPVQDDRPLDDVAQLADVAGPGV